MHSLQNTKNKTLETKIKQDVYIVRIWKHQRTCTGPCAWWLFSLNFGHEVFKRIKGAQVVNISIWVDQKLALKHKGNKIISLIKWA